MGSQSTKKKKFKLEPYLLVLPAITLVLLFFYYPFLKTAFDSFFLLNVNGQRVEFVGFENYLRAFSDDAFIKSIGNTFLITIVTVPITISIAFVLALLTRTKRKTTVISSTLFSLTMAVSMSVAGLIFKLLMNPQIGMLNYILDTNYRWFQGEESALIAVMVLMIWLTSGLDYLYLLAAVRNVPEELLESNKVDGGNYWHSVKNVFIPICSPTLFFLLLTNTANSMMTSSLILILTQGGPNNATSTMMSYMYKQAFEIHNYGASYAVAIITFLLVFTILALSFKLEKKGVHYQ